MTNRSVRRPAVAGAFYANSESKLRAQVEWCFRHPFGPGALPILGNDLGNDVDSPRKLRALVNPHAGYLYSGPVAAHGFQEAARDGKPDVVVIVGPNHRGIGAPIAIGRSDAWQTPLGEVALDVELGTHIMGATPGAQFDDLAHKMEHSVELQLPFLQYLFGDAFRIVPVVVLTQNLVACAALGHAIASAASGRNVLIIATTDFTHYETNDIAAYKDHIALECILHMQGQRLFEAICDHSISMCGPGPVAAAIAACEQMGATGGTLLRYATSGDVTDSVGPVVGYASVKLE
ncbi:MAG: AmmeMemoRadiSam system protein B [Chloroflexi bacterium]|nr:AmmeMemoRadiSam system protein B [Chloroflexota bacterium]